MDKLRDFARPPQVENLINAEAGLLTCSVRAAFPPLFGSDHNDCTNIKELTAARTVRDLHPIPFSSQPSKTSSCEPLLLQM